MSFVSTADAAVVKFLKRPLVQSAVRHFVTAFAATFVVAVIPVVQDITSGKSINVSATEALVVAAFVGGLAAGARAALPYAKGVVHQLGF